MKKVVLFDFDGTVVDSMGELADWASELIYEHYGLSISFARELFMRTSGIPFCEQMEIMFPKGNKNSLIVDIFENRKEREFTQHKVFPDTQEVFQYLRDKGYIVGISSSNMPHIIKKFLENQGVKADEHLGFDEDRGFGKGKPHFDYVKDKYKVSSEQIVFVGDSIKDGEKAATNSIEFIAKVGINSQEDFSRMYGNVCTIDTLADLKKIL